MDRSELVNTEVPRVLMIMHDLRSWLITRTDGL